MKISIWLCYIESAKYCYSGHNSRFAEKQCSSGSLDIEYACQKFTCVGGKCKFLFRIFNLKSSIFAPFVLRTCANKNMGCIAAPRHVFGIFLFIININFRICQISGGKGNLKLICSNLFLKL